MDISTQHLYGIHLNNPSPSTENIPFKQHLQCIHYYSKYNSLDLVFLPMSVKTSQNGLHAEIASDNLFQCALRRCIKQPLAEKCP